MSSTLADAGPRRFRPHFWPTAVTLVGLAVLLGLGTWQLQRLGWKQDLITRAEAQLAQPATGLPAGADNLPGMDFRRVAVRGVYLHEHAFAFGLQASNSRPGAHLVTPFRLEDGRTILIDRGWLPEDLLPPRVPEGLQPEGSHQLTGIARWRVEPGRNWMTPTDQPGQRRWFSWDIPAMAAATGLPLEPLVVVLEQTEGPAGLPKAAPVNIDFPNNHLSYAITWYGLAAALLAIYVLFSFSPRHEQKP